MPRSTPLLSFSRSRSLALPLAFTLFAACSSPQSEVDEVTANFPTDSDNSSAGKEDSSQTLRVRAADTTLWLNSEITRSRRSGQDVLVIHGRTSRDLTNGLAFVADDPYGEFHKLSARVYEVTIAIGEAAGLVHGINQFTRLDFRGSAGATKSVFARVTVRPRVTSFSGSGIYLASELTPVVSGGRTVFRLTGTAKSKLYGITARAAGVVLSDLKQLDDTHFQVDLLTDQLLALIGTNNNVEFDAQLLSGRITKRARIGLSVKQLGFSEGDGDPYEIWPRPGCTPQAAQCLAALPPGTTDLGSCGEALVASACIVSQGAIVDEVSLQRAQARGDALTMSAGFQSDANALVGSAKVLEFTSNVKATIDDRLEQQLFGRRFLDVAARDAALDALVDATIDNAYATPLAFVEPWQPLPNDLARARHIAADTLLNWLATHDLTNTEWGRPLTVLTKQFRARHVAAMRYFREEAVPASPTGSTYIGDWLDALVEVTIDPATGASNRILFEID